MPLIQKSNIVGPLLFFRMPEESTKVFLVVLDRSRAFVFSLLGQNKAIDKRFEGCSERCLYFVVNSHFSFWDPPVFTELGGRS